jgi:polyhydroxybutyrate depolymerase
MHHGTLAAQVFRNCTLLLPACLLTLVLGFAAPADAAGCDTSGFDKPCPVQEGTYRALMPEGEGPFPVMVYLYGSGGRSADIANHPFFDAAVVQRGYALIVPAALGLEYRAGFFDTGWALRHEAGGTRDEVLFISRVMDDVGQRFPIDRDRVVFVGQSRGAFLIWEIACHEPETASAYAVHAGGYLGDLPEDCERPVRFLHSHGLADPVVPFNGDPFVSGGATTAPLDQSLALLARTNRCRDENPGDPVPMLSLQRQQWVECAPGSSLDLLLHDGGHAMPADWFRAVLDWFEEPPATIEDVLPLTRSVGARPSGRFKSVPTSDPALRVTGGSQAGDSEAREPVAGRRLQAPATSKKASQ